MSTKHSTESPPAAASPVVVHTAYGQVPKRPVELESIHIHDLWHIALRLPDCDRDAVLDVWQLAHDLQEYVLNNTLIAAAPELLAALIDLREWVRNPGSDDSPANEQVIDQAEAAIARATEEGPSR